MKYQIEITTRCNYSCNYCSGRAMIQQDMDLTLYKSIIDNIPIGSNIILQGEGEPTLHPYFWEMCEYARDHNISTTLNGTQLDETLINKYFTHLNISVDTLDATLADKIGRVNLSKVLNNIENLSKVYKNIVIKTVDFGQPLTSLQQWVNANNFRHVIQRLNTKIGYPNAINMPRTTLCSYRLSPKLKYFTVTGKALPCCFIKNDMPIPEACNGCTVA